jgi:8-oxo-dGTP pyrophosphatase MutT (NUDIX family)
MTRTPSRLVEVSAGAVVIREYGDERQALVIRLRSSGYEIPKGHLEAGEDERQAALRELREESGLSSEVSIGCELATLEYSFQRDGKPVAKRVHYFLGRLADGSPTAFAALPDNVRERRWITRAELSEIALVHEDLRAIIAGAMELASPSEGV